MVCSECGNEQAAEGYFLCSDCLEREGGDPQPCRTNRDLTTLDV